MEGRTAPQGQGGIRKEGRARARRGKQRPAVPLRDPAGDRERDIHLHGRPVRRGGQDAQLHRLPRGDRHTPGAPQSARRGASTGRQARPAVHPPDRAGGHDLHVQGQPQEPHRPGARLPARRGRPAGVERQLQAVVPVGADRRDHAPAELQPGHGRAGHASGQRASRAVRGDNAGRRGGVRARPDHWYRPSCPAARR